MRIGWLESEIGKILEVELTEAEEAIAISDTHLGLKYKGRELSKSRELSEFLEKILGDNNVKLIVLLGDIFDFWSAKVGDIIRSAYDPVKVLVGSDKTIIYVAGNHDRIVSWIKLESSRGKGDIYTVPDFFILNVGGRKYLLLHGHQLDALFTRFKGLWKIQSYVYILSESLFSLPGPSEWMLAALSAGSFAFLLASITANNVLQEFILFLVSILLLSPLLVMLWRKLQDRIWYGLLEELNMKLSKSRLRGKSLRHLSVSKPLNRFLRSLESIPQIGRIDGVVLGHTHVPELLVEEGRVYANTGSWIENGHNSTCTFVRITSHMITLGKWENGRETKIHEASLPGS
ncbi:UDP-2,3-diacylglucosamine diphosphatase [Infirmifilum uzonense]|uniref:UDP-2,3-diacylglucosamine diphosphatase n=1 Tax=Infirmifilum uzonense TaxID=1550241 RepID=UPI003C750D11